MSTKSIADIYISMSSNGLTEARFEKGEDIGEKGKTFNKIVKSATRRYGSEEIGKRVAGAVLKKVLAKEDLDEQHIENLLTEQEQEDEDARFNKWQTDIKTAHSDKPIKFKGRVEDGKNTISAEHGDKSYGVWDSDTGVGHIFNESAGPKSPRMISTKGERLVKASDVLERARELALKDHRGKGKLVITPTHIQKARKEFLDEEAVFHMDVDLLEEWLLEDSDTGGDPSAYNKWLLGKLKDLPKTKKGYMAGKLEEESHAIGEINNIRFGVIFEGKCSVKSVKKQNPHLTDEEANAIAEHFNSEAYKRDGVYKTVVNEQRINVRKSSKCTEGHDKPKELNESVDTITVDVPLMIRIMEYAREDAKSDEDLHSATEKMLTLGGVLTMNDYSKIFK